MKRIGILENRRRKLRNVFLPQGLADDEIKRLVRRAVSNTEVPADLEARVLKSLREQSIRELK